MTYNTCCVYDQFFSRRMYIFFFTTDWCISIFIFYTIRINRVRRLWASFLRFLRVRYDTRKISHENERTHESLCICSAIFARFACGGGENGRRRRRGNRLNAFGGRKTRFRSPEMGDTAKKLSLQRRTTKTEKKNRKLKKQTKKTFPAQQS